MSYFSIICFAYPGNEAMAHVLGHGLVLLQLLEEDLLVEGADVLEVAEDDGLLAAQRARHLAPRPVPHRAMEGVQCQLQVLDRHKGVDCLINHLNFFQIYR